MLTLEMLRDQIASPTAMQRMLNIADEIKEAARSDERRGYLRASKVALAFPVSFHIAYFFYRWLRIVRPPNESCLQRFGISRSLHPLQS